MAYEDYEYSLPKKKLKKATLIKQYDLIRPTRCLIEESQRYLRLEHEDSESFVSYFTVNAIVGELDFPSSEIFYFQQQQFTFPVDTSMNVEIVGNRKALIDCPQQEERAERFGQPRLSVWKRNQLKRGGRIRQRGRAGNRFRPEQGKYV